MDMIRKGVKYIINLNQKKLDAINLLKEKLGMEASSEKDEGKIKYYEFNIKFALLVQELDNEREIISKIINEDKTLKDKIEKLNLKYF